MAKSVMKHQFSQVPKAEIQRSSFDRSHGLKTTFDAGLLVPIFIDEVLPGDTFNLRASLFGRLATPIKPLMDNLFVETFFFFTPNRLVWENWERFCGAQDTITSPTDYVVPKLTLSGSVVEGSLYDYFGIRTQTDSLGDINALPFRAYNLIYNEWFRDQNMQNKRAVPTGDTGDVVGDYQVRRRGKRHDYFTSALPWPQKGDPVSIPLGADAPVFGVGVNTQTDLEVWGYDLVDSKPDYTSSHRFDGANPTNYIAGSGTAAGNLYADLSEATATTINDLRLAFQIQRLLERDARGGTRYPEVIKAHFGVTSPDARLQRPEFLGGGSSMINVNPVAQTTPDPGATTPQGNLAAFGTVSGQNHGFTKSFTEHGYVIGLVNVRADLTYQQGIQRLWSRETRFDFYWPVLAHLGEQAIKNREIFAAGGPVDDEIFGYQEAWAEYRYKPSMVTGLFRSDAPTSLDVWHLSQDFADTPLLNAAFIEDKPPIDRVSAVQTEPHMLLDAYFNFRCARPMPIYGVPGLIDHF